jgi:DNA invertase Pin-like site-specific DNA recombinase
MTRYVAYYRVSTDKQGKSGLGLDAQRQAVGSFVAGRGEIVAEHTEIESTRNQRPELQAALDVCRRRRATLLIARLDRLARNVAFISNLMESRVEFVAVDMPDANRLTVHILAAVAEHEREMISQRTKDALRAAKRRGVRLGNPHPLPASRLALAALKQQTREFHATVRPLMHTLRQQGYSFPAIARELNTRHIPTARGGLWYPATVRNILLRNA